ncbi:MAG: molybdate ABC transporter substrate-binding protein [Clostridia bacterium]|nr:molybdate ABC transporter substrate-binding protein [Clostridia bacterium]
MKKSITLILVSALALCLFAGCGTGGTTGTGTAATTATATVTATTSATETGTQTGTAEPVELTVFAAASMTESMNQIAELYKAAAPNVTLVFNFDSSGTLETQIEEGADCDIFISAGQKQMNQLDKTADASINTKGNDFVLADSRFNIVSNTVVLIVPEGSDKGITSFDDVNTDKVSLIALGNSDVPVGQYSEEIFTNMGIWEDLNSSKKISFGSNVKEVLAQVQAASVDCGVVYSTDAATATGVTVVATAPEGSHKAITYPAAIMNVSENQAAAADFMAFLRTDACAKVFKDIGFSIPTK